MLIETENKIHRSKSSSSIKTDSPIMVCMIQQPVLQVCREAVECGIQSCLFSSVKITVDSTLDKRDNLWIDKKLFTEALIEVLTVFIANNTARKVINIGMYNSSLVISGDNHASSEGDNALCSARTREIISQHRAAMSLQKNKIGEAIVIRFTAP